MDVTAHCFRVAMDARASLVRGTLGAAAPLVTAAAATPAGQAALVLFGAAAVICSVGYTVGKIADLVREQRQKAHRQ